MLRGWNSRRLVVVSLLMNSVSQKQSMPLQIKHRRAAFCHVLGQPDVRFRIWLASASCLSKIMLNHPEVVKTVGPDRPAEIGRARFFPNGSRNPQVQRP